MLLGYGEKLYEKVLLEKKKDLMYIQTSIHTNKHTYYIIHTYTYMYMYIHIGAK